MMEIAFTPHDFAYQRQRGIRGFSHPDDPRVNSFVDIFINIQLAYAHGNFQ